MKKNFPPKRSSVRRRFLYRAFRRPRVSSHMPISRLSFSSISSTDSRWRRPGERLAEPLPNPARRPAREAVRVEESPSPRRSSFVVVRRFSSSSPRTQTRNPRPAAAPPRTPRTPSRSPRALPTATSASTRRGRPADSYAANSFQRRRKRRNRNPPPPRSAAGAFRRRRGGGGVRICRSRRTDRSRTLRTLRTLLRSSCRTCASRPGRGVWYAALTSLNHRSRRGPCSSG